MKPEFYFVLDVESVGLYGLGFAVGWVVINGDGQEVTSGYLACPYNEALHSGSLTEDHQWVEKNVIPNLDVPNCLTLPDLYERFWSTWLEWRSRGALMAADVCYPVETNFLRSCVLQDPKRAETAPFPLLDVATLVSMDKTYKKLPLKDNEKPQHHPTRDARYSARILGHFLRRRD
jgi:hypothetical protein